MNVFGQITFPTQNLVPHLVRSCFAAIAVLVLIGGSVWLLKKSGIPAAALGVKISLKGLSDFLFGALIAMSLLALVALILYVFVPFHFERGPLNGAEVMKEAHSYFWGNFLEELMFRGYPLVVISQLFGWRKAVWILALPFGLFHLPGIGFNMKGLEMMITTATYSFVFCYAFILTGSLWTATGVHVTSNILLHAVSGLDGAGKAVYKPVFETTWPVNYDPGLLSLLPGAAIVAFLLFILIKRRFHGSSSQPSHAETQVRN